MAAQPPRRLVIEPPSRAQQRGAPGWWRVFLLAGLLMVQPRAGIDWILAQLSQIILGCWIPLDCWADAVGVLQKLCTAQGSCPAPAVQALQMHLFWCLCSTLSSNILTLQQSSWSYHRTGSKHTRKSTVDLSSRCNMQPSLMLPTHCVHPVASKNNYRKSRQPPRVY